MDAGRLFSFHFPCRVKPRMTQKSWWKHKAYFEWCSEVQMEFGHPKIEELAGAHGHVKIHLTVGRPRLSVDVSNCLKAVEDALRGYAYPDDKSKYLCGSSAEADWGLDGFTVEITPCDGKCNFDKRERK